MTGLLERELASAWLGGHLDAVRADRGRLIAVTGEAGIGKTSLVRQFVDRHRRDLAVRWGSCDPYATQRPLAPLGDLAGGASWIDLLNEPNGRSRVFDALLDDLSRQARPGVMVVDDIHWADDATLDLLVFLRRRIDRTRCLVVVTFRDDEVTVGKPLRSTLGDLIDRSDHQLRLAPLSTDAVAAMAAGSPLDVDDLHRVTGGNPFFITETLADTQSEVPATVRDAVRSRARGISSSATTALDMVAIIPGGAEVELVCDAAEVSIDAVDELLDRRMLEEDGHRVRFRHELARRSWLEGLSAARQRRLHHQMLSALLRAQMDSVDGARLAHHAIAWGDRSAILEHVPVAARSAASLGAHREASAHYSVVARHAEWLDATDRAAFFEAYAYECYLTDDLATAIDAQQRAFSTHMDTGNREAAGNAQRWLSRLSWFLGDDTAALRNATEAIATLEQFAPTVQLAMAYSNLAQLHMLQNHHHETMSWGGRALALAESLGDAEVSSHALNNMGAASWNAGDLGGAELLRRSLDIAVEHGLGEHAARAYTNFGASASRTFQLHDAVEHLTEGIEYCIEHDLDTWRVYMSGWLARCLVDRGQWAEGTRLASWVLSRPNPAPVSQMEALVALGLVRSRRGDPDARSVLDRAWGLAQPTGEIQRIAPVVAALAEADRLAGVPTRAVPALQDALRMALENDDPFAAGELATHLHRAGEPVSVVSAVGPYRMQLDGDVVGAADEWLGMGYVYVAADVRGDSDDPAQLELALATLTELGATARAKQVADRMRAFGRPVPRGSNRTTKENPAGLTDREMDVAGLVAEGMTDQEIADRLVISRKTVGHHVSHVLAKLGVRNRSAAAAALARIER